MNVNFNFLKVHHDRVGRGRRSVKKEKKGTTLFMIIEITCPRCGTYLTARYYRARVGYCFKCDERRNRDPDSRDRRHKIEPHEWKYLGKVPAYNIASALRKWKEAA